VVLMVSPGPDVCLRVGALIVRRSVRALETTRRKWPQRQFANQKALVANAKAERPRIIAATALLVTVSAAAAQDPRR